jgi:hypothetical protein
MVEPRDQSHPPSDPRPVIARGGLVSRAAADQSARAQLVVALIVGLVLVAGGLYLWRRPRGPADTLVAEAASASVASRADDAGEPTGSPDAGIAAPVMLSDARVLACHDPGPRKTPADQCDHVAPIEKALANAVEQAAACVPESVGAGTIEYVADVSFLRHKVSVILPHAGRSVRDRRVLVACATAVRSAMVTVGLGGIDHQHARYKISVTATYKHTLRGG